MYIVHDELLRVDNDVYHCCIEIVDDERLLPENDVNDCSITIMMVEDALLPVRNIV